MDINLRKVVRAMNHHRDTYAAPAYAYVQCYLNGRRRLTVTEDGTVQIGREKIAIADVPLLVDTLNALVGRPSYLERRIEFDRTARNMEYIMDPTVYQAWRTKMMSILGLTENDDDKIGGW